MRGNVLPILLTAVFLLGAAALVVPSSVAQVGASTLKGTVCSVDNVYYMRAPAADQACASGRGIPDATVRLTKPGTVGPVGAVDRTAKTDSGGVYSFTGLDNGDYTLTASHAGFSDSKQTATVSGGSVADVVLAGNAITVTGKVLGDKGQAIPGASVYACCSGNDSQSVPTAQDGSFALSTVAGTRSFSVSQARGFQDLNQELFVDGTSPVEFRLVPVPPQDATLSGVVKDQDGTPVAGVQVTVYSYPNQPQPAYSGDGSAKPASSNSPAYYPYYGGSNYTVAGADGRYKIHVYGGGSVSVSVSKEGYASFNANPTVAVGESKAFDITLQKYPAKTARIEGTVLDAATGKAVPFFTVSVRSPLYGLYECSQDASASGSGGSTTYSGGSGVAIARPYPGPYENPGCAITVESDGTFHGLVTPGYAVIQVYADSARSCVETRDAGGSSRRACGPEYLSWSRSLVLPTDDRTPLRVELQQRPAPDAVVSGYLVDATTGKAIPNAQVSFNNEETYAYGYAQTDADGSFKLRLRHGYHSVSASAEGHLSWQGNLMVETGDQPFDILLQPGQESYGGCCYGCCYAQASDGVAAPAASGGKTAGASSTSAASGGEAQGGAGQAYEDLHGGLGPYDASARQKALDAATRGSPSLQVVMVAGVLLVGAIIRRRA